MEKRKLFFVRDKKPSVLRNLLYYFGRNQVYNKNKRGYGGFGRCDYFKKGFAVSGGV